jgi:hypothetical protein
MRRLGKSKDFRHFQFLNRAITLEVVYLSQNISSPNPPHSPQHIPQTIASHPARTPAQGSRLTKTQPRPSPPRPVHRNSPFKLLPNRWLGLGIFFPPIKPLISTRAQLRRVPEGRFRANGGEERMGAHHGRTYAVKAFKSIFG